MILIGEKLNSSIPSVLKLFNTEEDDKISSLIKAQEHAGADYADINTAMTSSEIPLLKKYIGMILEKSNMGIVLDSPNPDVQLACLQELKGRKAILNSVTPDPVYDDVISAVASLGCGVIGMPMDGKKVPTDAASRLENARILCQKLVAAGIRPDNIYIDCLVGTAAAEESGAAVALETVTLIHRELPNVKTVCGLSNVSFGLPLRGKVNSAYMTMMCMNHLDAVICDVTSEPLMTAYRASQALLGNDEFCIDFIEYARELM